MAKAHIAIISASTRKHRLSHRVALFLNNHLHGLGYGISLIDLNEYRIPLFEETIDKLDIPDEHVLQVFKKLNDADALIFVSPEYNGSYTSALKNLVDHYPKSTFHRKPIGVVSVSTGALGGMRGALQMQDLAAALYGITLPQMLLVPHVQKNFNEEGNLIDDSFIKNINAFVSEFLWLSDVLTNAKTTSDIKS
jgi:NAD(P)H-dependent FMN reductase